MNLGKDKIIYHPIGIFRSSYTPATGAPRQGVLYPDNKGIIEIFPPYHDALETLNQFERIIVLFHFHKVENWDSRVSPPSSTHKHNFGLFSTRSPKRPNPIGFTNVKLDKIENGKLYVSGLDVFDGTPVLDLKPHLPSIDNILSKQDENIEKILGHHDEDFINDPSFFY